MTSRTKNVILVSAIIAGLLVTTIIAVLSIAEAQWARPYPPIEPAPIRLPRVQVSYEDLAANARLHSYFDPDYTEYRRFTPFPRPMLNMEIYRPFEITITGGTLPQKVWVYVGPANENTGRYLSAYPVELTRIDDNTYRFFLDYVRYSDCDPDFDDYCFEGRLGDPYMLHISLDYGTFGYYQYISANYRLLVRVSEPPEGVIPLESTTTNPSVVQSINNLTGIITDPRGFLQNRTAER